MSGKIIGIIDTFDVQEILRALEVASNIMQQSARNPPFSKEADCGRRMIAQWSELMSRAGIDRYSANTGRIHLILEEEQK